MTRSETAHFALILVLAGLALCGLKWAGWSYLAETPWWQVAAAPAAAAVIEFVVLFGSAFAGGSRARR